MEDPLKPNLHFGSETNRHLTEKQAEVTGKRYCTQCNSMQDAESGVKRGQRWLCSRCNQRRKARILTGKF